MDTTQEQTKKCFCARCFLPIDAEDKVDVEGQNFHRICSTCCICRTIPSSLKMFYGHVFCNDCFKTHVLTRFRGENPRLHSNSWWMQWAPGAKPQDANSDNKNEEPKPCDSSSEEPTKKCICARCLQAVDESNKIEISGQSFHCQCAKCYFCHTVPTSNVKIYYGQVFCEECFQRHILSRNKDNPSEFFKNCFEQWQNNAQFAENMREFMAGNKESPPFVFMMQGPHPPFCRCGTSGNQEWFPNNDTRKSATPATVSIGDESLGTWDLSFENRTEVSDFLESCNAIEESANQEITVSAAEKIEKLTKYLHERDVSNDSKKCTKKWKNFVAYDTASTADTEPSFNGWVDLQISKSHKAQLDCPKCLWQCGHIYVNSEYFLKEKYCGELSFE